jgi:hypothetical protein
MSTAVILGGHRACGEHTASFYVAKSYQRWTGRPLP